MAPISNSSPALAQQFRRIPLIGMLCGAVWMSGCGRSELPNASEFRAPGDENAETVRLEVVDLPESEQATDHGIQLVAGSEPTAAPNSSKQEPNFAEGSPEWLILELAKLASSDSQAEEPAAALGREDLTRLHRMIELATEVVAKTHQDAGRQQLFNNAVHYLGDARMRLAVAGDREQGQFLSQEADALFSRDATGFAAAEAASKLVRLTQIQAERNVDGDPQWLLGFARQTRLFAEKFPQESSRCGVNLVAAARMCDRAGLLEEARVCVNVLHDRFPETPFAEQTQGLRRRLELPGKVLTEFGGSTFDGGFVTVDRYRGKPLLIAFWAANSAAFQADLVSIDQATARHGDRVAFLGVNLDWDEANVRAFLERSGNSWKHIFYSDPAKRGDRNVLAEYYGVTKVPSYWLIDAHGVVRSVQVEIPRLDQHLAEAMSPPEEAAPAVPIIRPNLTR